jgi:hypothetical protein
MLLCSSGFMNRIITIVFLGLFALSTSGCNEVAKRAGKAMKGADEAAQAVPAAKAARATTKPMTMSEKAQKAADLGNKAMSGKSE